MRQSWFRASRAPGDLASMTSVHRVASKRASVACAGGVESKEAITATMCYYQLSCLRCRPRGPRFAAGSNPQEVEAAEPFRQRATCSKVEDLNLGNQKVLVRNLVWCKHNLLNSHRRIVQSDGTGLHGHELAANVRPLAGH